jgi:diphosphomevalonate decarboxylase
MKSVLVRAPSNIALVKYMGKQDPNRNIPANPSLSMTLLKRATWVHMEKIEKGSTLNVVFELFNHPVKDSEDYAECVVLNHKQQQRCQKFFMNVLQPHLGGSGTIIVKSMNTFPMGSGIASSASSFAGLTFAYAHLFGSKYTLHALSQLSRQGSGSSCRSFEGPWVSWDQMVGMKIQTPHFADLKHCVVLVSQKQKEISSSLAHQYVRTSPLWSERPKRSTLRYAQVIKALRDGDWCTLVRESFYEALEMHSLFHTAAPFFSYWQGQTLHGLQQFQYQLSNPPRGVDLPILTLDAGPNLHFIMKPEHYGYWKPIIQSWFPAATILEDQSGTGVGLM